MKVVPWSSTRVSPRINAGVFHGFFVGVPSGTFFRAFLIMPPDFLAGFLPAIRPELSQGLLQNFSYWFSGIAFHQFLSGFLRDFAEDLSKISSRDFSDIALRFHRSEIVILFSISLKGFQSFFLNFLNIFCRDYC